MDAAALANGHGLGRRLVLAGAGRLWSMLYTDDSLVPVFGAEYYFMDFLAALYRCFASASQGATARSGWALVVPWPCGG